MLPDQYCNLKTNYVRELVCPSIVRVILRGRRGNSPGKAITFAVYTSREHWRSSICV